MDSAANRPDYHVERIDGSQVAKPLPRKLHVFVQSYLVAILLRDLPREYRAGSELNVICGADRLVPDITVMKRNARYEDGDLADAPVLAIEILSPGQTVGQLFDKPIV